MNKKYLLIFAVLFLSAITSFWMLPAMSLRSHECFVSVTAREMLQKNDYVWPTMNGVSRIQKPPLCYWLVAAVAKVTGTVDELTARIPSAFFAFLSAVAILFYLNKWLSLRIAAISAAVWATSLTYIRCSHQARPDMVMAFFVILCMLSFYALVISETRRQQVIHAIVFWISFALANLAKGPAPIPYVLIPIAVYIIFSKRWRIVTKMLPFIGSLIFILIVVPWFLLIANRLNWNLTLWKKEYFDRLFGDYAAGNYPFYYYLIDMFKYITPWAIFLPIALFTPFYKVWAQKRPVMTYLWIWFVADIIFLTLDAGKRQHYILPLIPSMAILIGIILEDMIFSRKAYPSGFAKKVLLAHAVGIVSAAIVVPIVLAHTHPDLLTKVLFLTIVTIIMMIVTIILFAKQKPEWATISVFSSITVFIILCLYNFSAAADLDAESRDFAKKIATLVPASDKLVAYGHVSSKFAQYYGQVVPILSDIPKLKEYYKQGCWVLWMSDNITSIEEENFNLIYSRKETDESKSDSVGSLFHKSANEKEILQQ